MEGIKDWFSQYWAYAIGLVVVCVAAAFIVSKAVKSYKRYYKNYREQESKIKHLVALKEKYGNLTEDTIKNADENELLEGVALSFQLKLQKSETMDDDFEKLEKEKQYIYALDVLVSDKKLEEFFRQNGRQLTERIVPALKMIGLEKEAAQAEKIRIMFDEKDETTSINKSQIENSEKYFEDNDVLTKIKHEGGKYIKENPQRFV